MEFSFQWYHETVRSSLINHELRSPASKLPCLPPLLMSSPTVITDEVNIIWICKGLHKTVPGMSASSGASLVSGCIISDIGNAAQLSRDYLGELQPPYQNLLQVTTQADTLTYIKVFSECMPVSSAPGSDDSRQLLSSLRCRAEELPANTVHTVHQAAAGARKYCLFYCSHLQWHKQITSDKRPQHTAE